MVHKKIIDREKSESSQEVWILPTVKSSNNNGLIDSGNSSILSSNRYQNLDGRDANRNTAIDINNTECNRETEKAPDQNIVCRRKHVAVNQHPENQTVLTDSR